LIRQITMPKLHDLLSSSADSRAILQVLADDPGIAKQLNNGGNTALLVAIHCGVE
jgi:hypothetical protein